MEIFSCLLRRGKIQGGLVKRLTLRYRNNKLTSLPHAVRNVVHILSNCVNLKTLDLSYFESTRREREKDSCLYELWRAIPAGVETLLVDCEGQVPFISNRDTFGLQKFLRDHPKLRHWEFMFLKNGPHTSPLLLSTIEHLAVETILEQDGSAPFQLHAATKMTLDYQGLKCVKHMSFPALEHVLLAHVVTYDDITHILCGSENLKSLVCNLYPSKWGSYCVWDIGSQISTLQELTIGVATAVGDPLEEWGLALAVHEYCKIKEGDKTSGVPDGAELCLKDAQAAVRHVFEGLFNLKRFPYLQRIRILIEVDVKHDCRKHWSEVLGFIENAFTCLRHERIEYSLEFEYTCAGDPS